MSLVEQQQQQEKMGASLRTARQAKGLTRQQLADRIGINISTITKWEQGINIDEAKYKVAMAAVSGKPIPKDSHEIIHFRSKNGATSHAL